MPGYKTYEFRKKIGIFKVFSDTFLIDLRLIKLINFGEHQIPRAFKMIP